MGDGLAGARERRSGVHFLAAVEYEPGHRLRFVLEDGNVRRVVLQPHLESEMFEALKDLRIFRTAKLNPDLDTVVRDNGADMSPDFLYEIGIPEMESTRRKVAEKRRTDRPPRTRTRMRRRGRSALQKNPLVLLDDVRWQAARGSSAAHTAGHADSVEVRKRGRFTTRVTTFWFAGLLPYDPVVLGVQSDPEPNDAARRFHTERSVLLSNSHGPVTADLLEMKRWMTRIRLEEFEVLVG